MSLRQIYESESKLRVQSVIPLILKSRKFGDIPISRQDLLEFIDPPTITLDLVRPTLDITITEIYQDHLDDIDEKMWSPLVNIAGYAAIKKQNGTTAKCI